MRQCQESTCVTSAFCNGLRQPVLRLEGVSGDTVIVFKGGTSDPEASSQGLSRCCGYLLPWGGRQCWGIPGSTSNKNFIESGGSSEGIGGKGENYFLEV